MSEETITVGEVVRNLQKLENSILNLAAKIDTLHDSVLGKVDGRIDDKILVVRLSLEARLAALESSDAMTRRIVYGAVSVILTAFFAAVVTTYIHT